MDSDSWSKIIIIVVLLLISAFFSAVETAFSSINRIRIKNLADNKDKRAEKVYKLTQNYNRLLSTSLVGNNIANTAAAAMATVLCVKHFGNAGVTAATIITTVGLLLFCEITPKSLAKKSPEAVALAVATLIELFVWIFWPINYLFSLWQKLLALIFKVAPEERITEEELLTIIEEAEQDGAINEADSELIHNAIEFNDKTAGDILTPRVDIIGISYDVSASELSMLFEQSGFSRIPVYIGSLDNIVGVINIKHFFNFSQRGGGEMSGLIKPVVFVPTSMPIRELFGQFKRSKSHLAVVTDEYGGTLGIVTMEDVLEELVGEIYDEHDEVVEDIVRNDDGTYTVNCGADIDDFFDFFTLMCETEASTVSGWIMEQLERIPDPGDEFGYEDITVTVTSTDQRRVISCLVAVNNTADKTKEAGD